MRNVFASLIACKISVSCRFFTCFFIILGFAQISYAESDTLKKLKKQGYATVAVANEPPSNVVPHVVVAVTGVSCRQQVEDGTGRAARFLSEILADALVD